MTIKKRRPISPKIREALLKKHDYKCVLCGITNDIIPLEIALIAPVSEVIELDEENLTVLCPNCHSSFDSQPLEYEFVSFLAELLNAHDSYRKVQLEQVLGKHTYYRVDLIANRISKSHEETILIECKRQLIGGMRNSISIINQLLKYKEVSRIQNIVLAVPATLQEKEVELFLSKSIEVWDLNYIANRFKEQIERASPSYYKNLFITKLAQSCISSRENDLIQALKQCPYGRKHCYVYQSLIGDILEHLFTPPLNKLITEHADKTKSNRRDFIMANYADNGFWSFVREKYIADYIIIDAKNYKGKVKKAQALQMANYLKFHGAGLFGIIICRNGSDSFGCEHTIREQWIVSQKVILVLNDDDVIEMLLSKSDGRHPEEILERKIEELRLSM